MQSERDTESPRQSANANDSWLAKLGPGLVTGAADDDPSGIATYSQAGAQFGYGLLWTLVFTYPLMVGIQLISARIGRVSGHGLATNIRRHYPKWLLYAIVSLLVVANTINIAADISAMADALRLIVGGSTHLYVFFFGVLSLLLQVFIPYKRYVRFLKWLTLALLAYVATVFVVKVPWGEVLSQTFVPPISWKPEYITTIVAVFGTTISPYLFFWQAGQEIEEQHRHHAKPLCITPREAGPELKRIRLDTLTGMAFSTIISITIVFATAATLNAHGITNITTSSQAAEALRPIAGQFAFALFALGIIGTGLLAVPVLAGSAAYAVTEMVGVAGSLDATPMRARLFYATIAVTTLLGASLNYVGIDPARALYWAAVVNGVLAAPLMAVMMLIVRNPRAMGRLTLGRVATVLGWTATAAMAAATAVFFATL
jgi:NRAMP (natural resistance-associated macrophage protein)-like metal ion transporter